LGTSDYRETASPAKRVTVNLSLIGFGLLVALILAEASLRLLAPLPFSPEVEYLPDGHLGARLAPAKTYQLKSGGVCSINNLGFRRNGDLSYAKPAGTFRIVALGGSSTFSYEVSDEHTWTAILEEKLRSFYGDEEIEVINAGVPGYSVFDSKVNYLYRIRPMFPDVVLVYHTWNDMKLFGALERDSVIGKGFHRESATKQFLRKFQLAWRLRNVYHQYIVPRQRENRYGDSGSGETAIAIDGPAHRWERKNFEDFALLLSADGVLPVFVSQATLLSTDNLDDPDVRANSYTEYAGLPIEQVFAQWQSVSEIIQDVADQNNLQFVDAFRLCPSNFDHFFDHVHLTETGNRAVAEIIFESLTTDAAFRALIESARAPVATSR
jgi:lysophospholipase L1-like esterase